MGHASAGVGKNPGVRGWRRAGVGILVAGVLSASAAGGPGALAASERPRAGSERVGLAYDVGGPGDRSFNDAAATGLRRAKADLGVATDSVTPTGDVDRARRLAALVDRGSGLVVGLGFRWTPTVVASAAQNPSVRYALVDDVALDDAGTPTEPGDDRPLPNVANLVFAEEEGSFLVGAAAALTSRTGTVGFVGAVRNPLIEKFEAGYVAGARAADPAVRVLVQYLTEPPDFRGFRAPGMGRRAATAQYRAGADVVYAAAGGSAVGVFRAARDAGRPGEVWAIGVDADQRRIVGPGLRPYVLTSMLKRVDVAVEEVVRSQVDGTFTPGTRRFDLGDGGVGYATSGGSIDGIRDQLDRYRDAIVAGIVLVPTTP